MGLTLVALLLQASSTPDRPIRVWLGSNQPVAPGEQVQVYVKTEVDGNLVVLRRTTDARIEVLFPSKPSDEAFVPRGTYEVRGSTEGGAFAALEPPGTGLVLAALSAGRFRTDEFVHQAVWNPAALVPSWSDADAEGALTDIVQRLLGDGYFVYDIVPYTVAPRPAVPQTPVAESPAWEPCQGCGFPSVTVLILPSPVLVCDPFLVVCDGLLLFPDRLFDRPPQDPAPAPERVLGIPSRSRLAPGVVARRTEHSRFVIPERPASPPPVVPRSRVPEDARPVRAAVAANGAAPARAIPVLRGRRPAGAAEAHPSLPAPRPREVRLAMPRTLRTDPTPPAPVRVTLAAVPAMPVGVASSPESPVPIAQRPTRTLAAVPAMVGSTPRATVGAAGGGGRETAAVAARAQGQGRVMAVPRGAESGARARAAVVQARRRQ